MGILTKETPEQRAQRKEREKEEKLLEIIKSNFPLMWQS